jgi:hypothetical protein
MPRLTIESTDSRGNQIIRAATAIHTLAAQTAVIRKTRVTSPCDLIPPDLPLGSRLLTLQRVNGTNRLRHHTRTVRREVRDPES